MDILELIGTPIFKKGSKIHIKKKNRGKFTEYCGGNVTQECIDKAKKSNNPTLRKRATFAENARRWKKHQIGGVISQNKPIQKNPIVSQIHKTYMNGDDEIYYNANQISNLDGGTNYSGSIGDTEYFIRKDNAGYAVDVQGPDMNYQQENLQEVPAHIVSYLQNRHNQVQPKNHQPSIVPKNRLGSIIKYWSAPRYDATSLKEAIRQAYRDGRKGEVIWYDGKAYKALLNEADEKQYNQHEKNRQITPEQVVDTYLKNVVWTMENPKNKGFNKRTRKYYKYKDSSIPINIGPGIAYTSDAAKGINFKKGYTKQELNNKLRPELLKSMNEITRQMHNEYGEDADTLSMGNRLIQLDIAHNVRPHGSKKSNMPITGWPSLTKAMMTGNKKLIEQNTNSGSGRRQDMRNMLIWKDKITKHTVVDK